MMAGHIIGKDLLVLTRDRRALAILVVMPLVFIAIIGFSTGRLIGWQNENNALRVILADPNGEELVSEMADWLRQRSGIDVVTTSHPQKARSGVDDGDRQAAIIVGPVFRQRVDALELSDLLDPSAGRLADGLESIDIQIYTRPTQTVVGALAEQLTQAAAIRVLLPKIARRDPLAKAYLDAKAAAPRPGSAESQPARAARSDQETSFSNIAYQIIVPAYAVLFAFFLINIMARSFISERAQGTLRRLRVAPISPWQLLIGKTAPFFVVSIVQGVLLFAFGKLLFGMSWGQTPWMLPVVIGCTSLAATALGLLTAVLVRTDAQVSAYANLLVITLGGLGGCFMPREWLPEAMRKVSLIIPHAWSLIAYDQILNCPAPDLSRVLTCCAVLVGFSGVFFILGWYRFRTLDDR